MGIFSSIGGIFGGGDDAAEIFEKFAREGIGELRRQFDETRESIDPFLTAGQRQVPGLESAASLEGFGKGLGEIFDSGALDRLIEERTRATQGQLAAGGLTRSGTALQEITRIPTELGFSLENLLNTRKSELSGRGLSSALGLGQLGAANAQGIAGLLGDIGNARAGGFLRDQTFGTDLFSQGLGALTEFL